MHDEVSAKKALTPADYMLLSYASSLNNLLTSYEAYMHPVSGLLTPKQRQVLELRTKNIREAIKALTDSVEIDQ